MSGAYIMRLQGLAGGGPTGHDGKFLKDFDFEAGLGTGLIAMTDDPEQAKQFETFGHALEFRNRVPACRPIRGDGMPNRPLTATNWEFLTLDAARGGK